MEAADWVDFAGFFGIRKSLEVELFEVVFSPTFDFVAESAAREGIEEGLALAAVLLMSLMGLIGDIVIKKFEKYLSPEAKITFVIVCARTSER